MGEHKQVCTGGVEERVTQARLVSNYTAHRHCRSVWPQRELVDDRGDDGAGYRTHPEYPLVFPLVSHDGRAEGASGWHT